MKKIRYFVFAVSFLLATRVIYYLYVDSVYPLFHLKNDLLWASLVALFSIFGIPYIRRFYPKSWTVVNSVKH